MRAIIATLLLGALLHVAAATAPPPWWDCIGDARRCPGYDRPCGARHTVESDMLVDMVDYSVAGSASAIYPLLHDDVTLTLPYYDLVVSGRRNVSIYLASHDPSANGSRSAYYHVDASVAYAVETLQEDGLVLVVVNQTVPNPFNPAIHLRQDLWIVGVDADHRVTSIEIRLDSLIAGATISDTPVIDESRVISCGLPPESRPYSPCIGRTARCPGYERPCRGDRSSLLKDAARYLAQNVTVDRQYEDILHLLANDSYQALPALGVLFESAVAILSYQYAGDPTRTDPTYLIENVTVPVLVQRGQTVVGVFDFYFYAFQMGVTFHLRGWWYLAYRPDNTLFAYIQEPDTKAVYDHFGGSVNTSIEHLCPRIAEFCVGPEQQYPVPSGPNQGETCEQYLSTLPALSPDGLGSSVGGTRYCVGFHLALAERFPVEHCPHTGGVPQLTPCVDAARRKRTAAARPRVSKIELAMLE